MERIKIEIRAIADKYALELDSQIARRVLDMQSDNKSHYLIYQVLGIDDQEGDIIDIYQNKGRFLYKYAGSFLEEVTILCFEKKFPDAQRKVKIANVHGSRPKTFEIDCLVDHNAYEIKWRDATTDGDHIMKEHTRIKSVRDSGYTPIRLMFYYPNRVQAIRIQQTLETVYSGLGGAYHFGADAWNYVKDVTGIDLHAILGEIAKENTDKRKN